MDRDRKLAELMGMCGWYCTKCDKPLRPAEVTYEENCLYCGLHLSDPDFSTPEWRARLMDWATEREWWEAFYRKTWREWYRKQDAWSVSREAKYIVYLWRNLPSLLVEYHGEGRK